MKSMVDKRTLRIEKKKKKKAAFLEIAKLNEHDRIVRCVQPNNNLVEEVEVEPNAKRIRTHLEDCVDEKMEINKPKTQKKCPKVRLREIGEAALLKVDIDSRIPLYLSDIQHLLIYAQIGNHAPYTPARWCQMEKYAQLRQTNVVILENISLYHYSSYESLMPFLSSTFPLQLEVISPGAFKTDIVMNIATIPLTGTQVRKYVNKYGTLEQAVTMSKDVFDRIENLFPVQSAMGTFTLTELHSNDKFPRTHLILSGWQLIEENYPLPVVGLMERKYTGYTMTKDSYKPVTNKSPMFGVDCEMVRTTIGDLELARVSISNENMEIIYDQLVKPPNQIVDYLTRYSGITAKMMKRVTKTLKDVQEEIRELLPADAILVGQSLAGDLHALQMMHPYNIDTSVIFNITGDRMRKTKLQTLALHFLEERIQVSMHGHCSAEDCRAALKLVQLKLQNNIHFGDAVMADMATHLHNHPELGNPHFATSMLKQATKLEKRALLVSHPDLVDQYVYYTYKDEELCVDNQKVMFMPATSNKSILKKFCENAGNTSFNVAHMRVRSKPEISCKKLESMDRYVRQVWEITETPGMVVVITGGHQDCGNGVAFIAIKN